DIPLAADPDYIGAEFQRRRDCVVDTGLDLVQWDTGNVLARGNQDISIRIRRRIVRRRQQAGELIGGIDEGIIGVEQPWRGLVLRPRLKPLSTGAGDVLEHAAALKPA